MKKNKKFTIVLSLIVIGIFTVLINSTIAQNRFGAGVILGLNASQIDGDERLGYHKPGLNAGIRGMAKLAKKIDLSTEILYSQRGSQSRLIVDEAAPYFKIKLDYIEVPVIFNYKDWETTGVGEVVEGDGEEIIDDTYHRVHFHAGFAFGRLFRTVIDQVGAGNISIYEINKDKFEKNNFTWLVGASFFLKKHLAFTLRFNYPINSNFDPQKAGVNANTLRNRHITFGFLYMI